MRYLRNFNRAVPQTRSSVQTILQGFSAPPRPHLWVLFLYIFLTGWMLYPLSFQFADHVPDPGDPLEYAWVIAWDSRQLVLNPLELYNANIYYPYPNALAFSESQVASGVLAEPIYLATGNAIFAYNFVFILAFILTAFSCYLLTFDLTHSRWGAVLAGFAFAFWAYRFNHIGHLNLVTLQWLPLVFLALRGALERGKFSLAWLFAVSFTGQALSSWYYALMTGLSVALYVVCWVLTRRVVSVWRSIVQLVAVTVPCLILIIVVGIPYFQVNRELNLSRSLADAQAFAARPISFLTVAPSNLFYHSRLPTGGPDALFCGLILLGLGIVGLIASKGLPDRWFWIALGILFFIISLGPTIEFSSEFQIESPLYRALYEWLPGFQGTRAPARFFVISMLALCVFAARGFGVLSARFTPRGKSITGLVLLALMAVEYNCAPLTLVPIETGAQLPTIYRWLAEQPEGNVLELPIRRGFVPNITRPMYYSTVHWHALPVGYGSFIPPTQDDFLFALESALDAPSARLPNLLREFGVRYVVVNETGAGVETVPKIEAVFAQIPSFEAVYADETRRLYRVNGDAPPHPLQFACLFPGVAAPGASYVPYLVVQQPRRYPIVNTDSQPHTFRIEWQESGTGRASQTSTIQLPYVLRERPEGIPIAVTAPNAPGDYALRCELDNRPLNALTQSTDVLVGSQFQINDATPPLELVTITTAPTELQAGSEVIATFFWRTRYSVRDDVWMRVQLVDENNHVWSELTRQPVVWTYPLRLWRVQELVADAYAVPIPKDAPLGAYRVRVTVLGDEKGSSVVSFRSPRGERTMSFESSPIQVRAP